MKKSHIFMLGRMRPEKSQLKKAAGFLPKSSQPPKNKENPQKNILEALTEHDNLL
ncbi:MAG: hypothetical protein KHX69_13780 [Clostridium sp.]|nr:hypothetical protein [Clostridium sp.]